MGDMDTIGSRLKAEREESFHAATLGRISARFCQKNPNKTKNFYDFLISCDFLVSCG